MSREVTHPHHDQHRTYRIPPVQGSLPESVQRRHDPAAAGGGVQSGRRRGCGQEPGQEGDEEGSANGLSPAPTRAGAVRDSSGQT